MITDLIRQAQSSNQLTAGQAVFALGESRDPDAVEALVSILRSRSGLVQMEAARALGKQGRPAIPLLERLIASAGDETTITLASSILKVLQDAPEAENVRSTLGLPKGDPTTTPG